MVNELHWKTINYLVNNYDNILIGDMSVKSIVSKNESTLARITKRIGYSLSLYLFKQRLEYKCKLNKKRYSEVNERYTSRMCSVCGWYNEKLGGDKIFECKECKRTIDRDVNGARGIYLKHLQK